MKTYILTLAIVALGTQVYAMGEKKESEELINQQECREHNHHYDAASKTCVYCSHHLSWNKDTNQCVGELSPLGKCFGDDHFHAATLECMYCAKGHEFNEETRKCESIQIILAD